MKISQLAVSFLLACGLGGLGVAYGQVPPPEVPPSRVPPEQLPPASRPPPEQIPPSPLPPEKLPPPKAARPTEKPKPQPVSVADVLRRLHRANLTEMEAGRIAKTNAGSKAVRSLADRLIKDHQSADKKVIELAKKRDIDLAAQNALAESEKREQGDMLQRLRLLKGQKFDQEFLTSMVTAHDQAISLLVSAQEGTTDSDLRGLAAELLPTLKEHRKMASDLSERSSGT